MENAPLAEALDARVSPEPADPLSPAPDRDLSRIGAVSLSRLWPSARAGKAGNDGNDDDDDDDDGLWSDEELAELLRRQLAEPLEGPPRAGGWPTGTFAELLAHPRPPLDRLQGLKGWAKPRMGPPDDELPAEIAGVLYFAAICCAVARCGAWITNLSDEAVAKGARWALRRPWVDAGTAAVLQDGLAAIGATHVSIDGECRQVNG